MIECGSEFGRFPREVLKGRLQPILVQLYSHGMNIGKQKGSIQNGLVSCSFPQKPTVVLFDQTDRKKNQRTPYHLIIDQLTFHKWPAYKKASLARFLFGQLNMPLQSLQSL